jgi:hypothetical protein
MPQTNTPLQDLLPAQVYRELRYKLRNNLPEPPTGDPADVERRLHSAIAEIAAYTPAGAAELNLARRYVEAAEAADECLRLAHQAARENSPNATKLRAQSASFMRQAQGYHTRLLRLQNERRKLEKDPRAANRAAWAEHCTIGLLADDELLESPSPQPITAPPPAPEPPSPPPPEPPAPLTEAELYATLYPERAARIRRFGRVLPDLDFDPPHPELVQALTTAHGPIFTDLDRRFAGGNDGERPLTTRSSISDSAKRDADETPTHSQREAEMPNFVSSHDPTSPIQRTETPMRLTTLAIDSPTPGVNGERRPSTSCFDLAGKVVDARPSPGMTGLPSEGQPLSR